MEKNGFTCDTIYSCARVNPMASAYQQLRELRHAILEHELSGGGRNVEMRRQFNAALRHHRQHPMQGGAPNKVARVKRFVQEKVIKRQIKMFRTTIARLTPAILDQEKEVKRLQKEREDKMATGQDIYTQIFKYLRTPAVEALEKIIDDSGLEPAQKKKLKGLIRTYGSTEEWMEQEGVKNLYQLTTKEKRWNKIYQAGGIIPQPTGGFVIPTNPTQSNPYLTLESMQDEYIKTFKDSAAHIMVITEPIKLGVDEDDEIKMTQHDDNHSCILYKTAIIRDVTTEGGDKYTITPIYNHPETLSDGSPFTLYNFHGNSKDDGGENQLKKEPSPNQTALRELVDKAKRENPHTIAVVCGDSNITRKKSGVSTQDELKQENIYGEAVTYSDRKIQKVRFPKDKDAQVDILLNNQTTKIGPLPAEVDGMFIVCLDQREGKLRYLGWEPNAGAPWAAATPLVALQSPYDKDTNPILADHQVLTATTTGRINMMVANGAEATHPVKGWLPSTAQASRDVILDIFETYENFSKRIGVPFTRAWNDIYRTWQDHGFEDKEPSATPPTTGLGLPEGLTLTTEQTFVDYWPYKPLEDAQQQLQTTKKPLEEAKRKLEEACKRQDEICRENPDRTDEYCELNTCK